jgi:hypothetical protein
MPKKNSFNKLRCFFVRWEFSVEIASENCLFKKNLDKIINLNLFFQIQESFSRVVF